MEYKIVWDRAFETFGKKVQEVLNDGWELYGDPFVWTTGFLCQAVIKYEAKNWAEWNINEPPDDSKNVTWENWTATDLSSDNTESMEN